MGSTKKNNQEQRLADLIFQVGKKLPSQPSAEIFPAVQLKILFDSQQISRLFEDIFENTATNIELETFAILPAPLLDIRSSLQTLPARESYNPAQLTLHSIIRFNPNQLRKREDLGFYSPDRAQALKALLQKRGVLLTAISANETGQNFSIIDPKQGNFSHILALGSPSKDAENNIQDLVRKLAQQKFHPNRTIQPVPPQPLKEIELITTFSDDFAFLQHAVFLGRREHQFLLQEILRGIGQEYSGKRKIPIRVIDSRLR